MSGNIPNIKPEKKPKPTKLSKLTTEDLAKILYKVHTGKYIDNTMLEELITQIESVLDNN